MVEILDPNNESNLQRIDDLKGGLRVEFVDNYDLFLRDLFELRFPHLYKKDVKQEYSNFRRGFLKDPKNNGLWAYYPWLKKAFLIPPTEIYFEIITGRNKPIISASAQKKYYNYSVGIVGMSVGQSSALMVAKSGGCQKMKIADPDIVSPSNLNRLHTGLPSVGQKKTESVAQKILEINPYNQIEQYGEGVNESNIDDFFNKNFKIDAVIDACDNFPIKILLREKAKLYGIPLLMATDLGDATLLDVERYDTNPDQKIFGGRLEKIAQNSDFLKTSIAIISPEYFPISVQEAVAEIGKTIPTHPQLASSSYFSGILINYALKRLSNDKGLPKERIFIDIEEYMNTDNATEEYKKIKEEKTEYLKKILMDR